MAFQTKQVSVTTSAQSLTALMGLSVGVPFFALSIDLPAGATETVYGAHVNTVTNVPANAGFKATATVPFRSPGLPFQVGHTDKTFLVATANVAGLVTLY